MAQFYVKYEVRRINAIGVWSHKYDMVEAEDALSACAAFRNKYREVYEFRSPVECEQINFTPTHRYLNIQTGEWEKVEFVKYRDSCNAYVKKCDGSLWDVGRPFLEKL